MKGERNRQREREKKKVKVRKNNKVESDKAYPKNRKNESKITEHSLNISQLDKIRYDKIR